MRRALILLAGCAAAVVAIVAAAPAAAQTGEPAYARGDTSSFWMSEEASADSLDAFWGSLRQEWVNELADSLATFGLTEFRVDSLRAIGDDKLDELVAGTLWRSELEWLQLPDYNRVQGPVARVGWSLRKVGPNRPVFRIQGGYAFANERAVGSARLDLPLRTRRWELSGGRGLGHEYQQLSLRLTARQDALRFAGDHRRFTRTLSALLYGADPNHYLEERRVDARLSWQITRRSALWLSGGVGRERALEQEMDFNLFDRDLSPVGNRRAEDVDIQRLALGGELGWGPLSLRGECELLKATDSTYLDRVVGLAPEQWRAADGHYARVAIDADLEKLDPLGNRWLLRGRYRSLDKAAPRQWRTWLGDWNERDGMLRGYEAGELSGEIAYAASADVRLNFDLWRTLRVPVLKKLGMQPLLFADWAKTENEPYLLFDYAPDATADPLVAVMGDGEQGWRADVGFGFAIPGLEPVSRVRVYAARAVGSGAGDEDWRVLLAFER